MYKNDVGKWRHLAVPGHVDYPLRKVVRPAKGFQTVHRYGDAYKSKMASSSRQEKM